MSIFIAFGCIEKDIRLKVFVKFMFHGIKTIASESNCVLSDSIITITKYSNRFNNSNLLRW